jgi:uncharacterized alkaline shock family protein YloU
MTDFSGDNLGAPNGLPTTKSPPPFPPRAEDRAPMQREPMSREPAPAAHSPAAGQGPGGLGPAAGQDVGPGRDQGPGQVPGQGSAAGGPAGPANGGGRYAAEVKGRIDVADEVVEKVAALAAIEVEGVADLGGDFERAIESVRERIGIGNRRGDQGVKAKITGREVAVDVTIMIEYGHVVMDVARAVKNNVANQTNRMLGLSVVEVNVTVDDVKMPERPRRDERDGGRDDHGETEGY